MTMNELRPIGLAIALPTPYDGSSPPTPTGLPQHVEIDFSPTDRAAVQPDAPILYFISVAAYQDLWAQHGDPGVSRVIQHVHTVLASRPDPIPTSGMPVLPFERVTGVNDLAVQGRYLENLHLRGVRFVGRFSQGSNPVTNAGLQYIFQGVSTDGSYLVAFFYPVTSSSLRTSAAAVPSVELQRVDSDPPSYLEEQAVQLNALASDAWEPNLAVLDTLIDALRFELTPAGSLTRVRPRLPPQVDRRRG
jgi:hypothetical protein